MGTLVLGLLAMWAGCCTEQQFVAFDTLLLTGLSQDRDLLLELRAEPSQSLDWSCLYGEERAEEDCQLFESDEGWVLSLAEAPVPSTFYVYEGEELLLEHPVPWQEEVDTQRGVCGYTLAWDSATVDLSGL